MPSTTKEANNLFPVFLKLEQMRLLLVGGGNVGLEKLTAVLQNSPSAKIRVVALSINPEIKELAKKHKHIELHERAFAVDDLSFADIVITAISDHTASEEIC